MKLNDQQRDVVFAPIDGTIKVTAGAGTGKTRVLVERYLHFLYDEHVPPDQLLALTFTKKAAAEMHKRVFEAVRERGDDVTLRALYGAWIMNFHQFAYRLLKENAATFGMDPDTDVATEMDLQRIRRRVLRRFELGTLDGQPEAYEDDMPVPSTLADSLGRFADVVEKARSALWTPELLLATLRDDDVPSYRRTVASVVAVWRAYENELLERRLVDFNDMIRRVVMGLANDETLRERFCGRYRHILVDEFQDTSKAQNELLRILSGGTFAHVTVVGDEKQSIYRWRDARVENLREFPGREFLLQTNYRSGQPILDAAHSFIIEDPYFRRRAGEIHLEADDPAKKSSITLFHPEGEAIRSVEDEAKALAAWILSLTGSLPAGAEPFLAGGTTRETLGFGEIAVLLRSLKASSGLPAYEDEFRRLGVPYAIFGGVSALEHQVLELFRCLLVVLVYPRDVRALLAVLEARPFSVPDKAIMEIFAGVRSRHHDVEHLLSEVSIARVVSEEARKRCAELRDLIAEMKASYASLDLPEFVAHALEISQFYYQFFEGGADQKIVDTTTKRIVELTELLVLRGESNLAALMEAIDTLLGERKLDDTDTPFFPEGRVRIMTVHQAKGLEFPAVAVAGIRAQQNRNDPYVVVEERGLYVREKKAYRRGDAGEPIDIDSAADQEQEEMCLLYVAMTRAQKYLFLSSPFAEGMERKKPNHFATIRGALSRGKVTHTEFRSAPRFGDHTVAPVDGPSVGSHGDLTGLFDLWGAGRERLDAAREPTPPASRVQFVTWRGLYTYRQCPLQYHYGYVARIDDSLWEADIRAGEAERGADEASMGADSNTLIPPAVSPAEFGTFVHRLFFEWLGAGTPEPEASEKLLDDIVTRFGGDDRARPAAAQIMSAYRRSELAFPDVPRRGEVPFQTRCGQLIFHGVIDRIDRMMDGARVVDYKVGAILDDHEFQVQFYAWALNRAAPGSVTRGVICQLGKETKVEGVDVGSGVMSRVEETALALEHSTSSSTYAASPGRVCRTCAFRELCPYASA
jgi:DNA helicase-2/ATP-dependent DNA helicase PcrA